MSDNKVDVELDRVQIISWVQPVKGIQLDGQRISLELLDNLNDEDAYGYGNAFYISTAQAKVLEKRGLISRRTRGSYYGTDKLEELLARLYDEL